MSANERQVGGDHYKSKDGGEEHWDRVHRLGLDYFQACITKYVERCWKKNGVEDLKKARHFLDKYLELHGYAEIPFLVQVDLEQQELMKKMKQTIQDLKQLIGTDLTDHFHPQVRAAGAMIKPTGWVGFTFEGADAEGFLFTCEECRGKFRTPPNFNPHAHHRCPAPV